jgi:hypothetical protein
MYKRSHNKIEKPESGIHKKKKRNGQGSNLVLLLAFCYCYEIFKKKLKCL